MFRKRRSFNFIAGEKFRRALLPVKYMIPGALLGSILTYIFFVDRKREYQRDNVPDSLRSFVDMFGLPSTEDHVLAYAEHLVKWDARTRTPRYVLELINRSTVDGYAKRINFTEEEILDPQFRNRLEDFKGSGFDRGHLAAAANHRHHQDAINDTFKLSNISPQVPEFNRVYWQHLEKFIRNLVFLYENVYVITGPLYLPTYSKPNVQKLHDSDAMKNRINETVIFSMNYSVIGTPPSIIHVPNYYFKVLLCHKKQQEKDVYDLAAFVLPNQKIDSNAPLRQFLVPLSALESAAGLKFFPSCSHFAKSTKFELDHKASALAIRPMSRHENQLIQVTNEQSNEHEISSIATNVKFGHLCMSVDCKVPALELNRPQKTKKKH